MRNLIDLGPRERRVIGALMEKEQTTPEYYPLTLKGLVAACNQKSNRDPVLTLSEVEVLNVLRVLLQDDLAERVTGARVDRWAHKVDPTLHYDRASKAVTTLLMLRGAQTLGELRSRSERLHSFDSLEEVDQTLQQLSRSEPPLVRMLPRQPGQKESRWSLDLPDLEVTAAPQVGEPIHEQEPARESIYDRLDRLEQRVATLEQRLAAEQDTRPPSVADSPSES